jgi:STE24 endopeptidase
VVQVEARAYFSTAELEKADSFRSGQLWLYGGRTLVELLVLVAAVRLAPRDTRRPVVTGAAAAAAITLVSTVVALPLRAASRERAKHVGLVTQSWGGWTVDVAKGAAIGGVLSGAGGALLVVGMRRFGRDWWAPGAAAVAGFALVFTYLGPVVLDPVFNKFTPLPAGATRDDVLELARRAGVEVGEVYEVDASRRTTAANAYVTGVGHTKRVVLYDTLLKDFTPAETRLVVAHELGHVRHRDVPRGLLWLALVAPFGTLAIARLSESLTRPGSSAVPAVALSLAIVAPALTTVSNQLSRAVERRADAFALDLTGEPDAMVAFERRITIQNVGDPDPPRWQEVVLGTHPPTMERIGQALAARSSPAGP